ncbi:MAG: Maf family protein [Parvularculales bacterium]
MHLDRSVPLILASTSVSRRRLAESAGLICTVQASGVDEAAIKDQLEGVAPKTLASALAEAKALAVSSEEPASFVIGADQILWCEGDFFDKAKDMAGARRTLEALRGRSHELYSAVVIARAGMIEWRFCDRAVLTMRLVSDGFLEEYLERVGEDILGSVGCYHLEGVGVQLFDKIEGSYFTVLGFPLLPLLEALRHRGVVGS